MFGRTKEYMKSNNTEVDIFIQGQEYNNSELLYKLDKVTEYEVYTITKYEHRIDLISNDIYGDSKYSWILMYINRIGLDELVRGTNIKYIPLTSLNKIINGI